MVFVNSMSDLFHENVPAEFIQEVWATMEQSSKHVFQILTKRPERMRDVAANLSTLPNVWLGTSVESRDYLGRLDELRATRASVRFVSFEPLIGDLGNLDLQDIDWAIVGGESGPQSRPMDPRWVTAIQRACTKSGTAFFFKQWGGVNKKKNGRKLDGKTWDELPKVKNSGYDLLPCARA